MRYHERMIMLSVLDQLWKDHLLSMDHLKEGIGLRGYAQHDPLVEYKRESFEMFEAMMQRFQEDTVRYLYLMQVIEPAAQAEASRRPVGGAWRPATATAAEMAGVRAALPPRWMTWKKNSSAASAANWNKPAWPAPATISPSSRSCARAPRSAATIPAPAAPARSTRSAAGRRAVSN